MDLYPAIDIRDGGAVRLTQGDFARQHEYGDPLLLAQHFAEQGAPWLHLVDLDGARSGQPVNRALIQEIASSVACPVETGGGVRTLGDVELLLSSGVDRVILGTAALDDPALAARIAATYPHQVAIGLDYRKTADGGDEVASHGWEVGSGRSVTEVLELLVDAPVAAFVVTAIDRDGMLNGPDLEGLVRVMDATPHPVIASGGVSGVIDLVNLAALRSMDGRGLLGAITGKALVDGRLTVAEGVAACRPSV